MATLIIKDPSAYKVCEGCGSIVSRQTVLCPNCNAYRFNNQDEYVVEQAILLASRKQISVTAEDIDF